MNAIFSKNFIPTSFIIFNKHLSESNFQCAYILQYIIHSLHVYVFLLQLKEYKVIGRSLPSDKNRAPPLYQMKIFAQDKCTAKSRFWYFVSQLRKMKKMSGEILSVQQVRKNCILVSPLQGYHLLDPLIKPLLVTCNFP